MIKHLYDDDYDLFPIYLDVVDQGHSGASRPRVYIICAHKERLVQLVDVYQLYNMITAAIRQRIQTTPKDYLVSDHWEIMRDAEMFAQKRGHSFKPAACYKNCF